MRALFDEVLRRTSSLTYAGQPSYLRSNFQRGVKQLPINWTAQAPQRPQRASEQAKHKA